MHIQTDAIQITQEELDRMHRMTKIARISRIRAQARAAKMREQVRILREAAQRVVENWEDGDFADLADAVRELSLVLDDTKD